MRARLRATFDLLGLLCLSALLAVAIYAVPVTTVRVVLGVPFILFCPGYALVAALFPRRSEIGTVERLGLSVGLSIPVVFFLGFVLNYTWGITLHTTFISIVLFVVILSVVAYYRRGVLPPSQCFMVTPQLSLTDWHTQTWLEKSLTVVLILSVIAVSGTLLYFLARPKESERFAEFYILGSDRMAEGYQREITAGDPITLIVGVVNREHSDVQYRIEREENGDTEQIANLQLGHEETWEQPYTFALTESGENRKVTFLLYKGDDEEPYRSLHLWITVKERPSAQ